MSCRARMNSGSTDLSSDSVDIEELSDSESDSDSDSDSTDTESDEENPANPLVAALELVSYLSCVKLSIPFIRVHRLT